MKDWDVTSELYKELNIFNLNQLLELEQCKFIHTVITKAQKGNTEIQFTNDTHKYNTRTHIYIYMYNVSTIGLNNPKSQASNAYNKLPNSIKSINNSFICFAKKLKDHIRSK
ncbi:unnamed protein product [Acanthoscelides obtectus]|uniref:Uncharacterized protein n=1 Tax=Acanthoscelides obtectus TaxID=200917 RepID=A0A9P0MC16_ACAOB|nr:unnamed protein product [Acanthoscelides obtectus]CAK1619891.1 hypothetical protein AOBTE_LOCUS63 [Acanthoscelides obtectus]